MQNESKYKSIFVIYPKFYEERMNGCKEDELGEWTPMQSTNLKTVFG